MENSKAEEIEIVHTDVAVGSLGFSESQGLWDFNRKKSIHQLTFFFF